MKKSTSRIFVAAMIVVAAAATILVGCKKEKDETTEKANTEATALLDRIHAFQQLRDAVNSGAKADGTMTVEEMCQTLDLVSNYEHSEHMVHCINTKLDTLFVPMPNVDSEGYVLEKDVIETYGNYELELQKCMETVDDGRNIPSYFSIVMPESFGRGVDYIKIVFVRGEESEEKRNEKNISDNDGPFEEDLDDWYWGCNLGLCKPDPLGCTSDASLQLSEEFGFVIPVEHQGETYLISNVSHVTFRPCAEEIPLVSSIYYVDTLMEDCADTWLYCYAATISIDLCINWDELNCYWRSIHRNIVDPNAPLHYNPISQTILAAPYHCCSISWERFSTSTLFYEVHLATVTYCDVDWPDNPSNNNE